MATTAPTASARVPRIMPGAVSAIAATPQTPETIDQREPGVQQPVEQVRRVAADDEQADDRQQPR